MGKVINAESAVHLDGLGACKEIPGKVFRRGSYAELTCAWCWRDVLDTSIGGNEALRGIERTHYACARCGVLDAFHGGFDCVRFKPLACAICGKLVELYELTVNGNGRRRIPMETHLSCWERVFEGLRLPRPLCGHEWIGASHYFDESGAPMNRFSPWQYSVRGIIQIDGLTSAVTLPDLSGCEARKLKLVRQKETPR